MAWQLAGYRYPQRYSKINSEHKKKFRNCSLAQQLFRNATQPRWWPFACINSLMNQLKNKDVCFTPNRYFFPSAWLSANICCTKANCIKSRKRKKKGKKNLYVLRQNAFLKPHWPWRPLGRPKREKKQKKNSPLFIGIQNSPYVIGTFYPLLMGHFYPYWDFLPLVFGTFLPLCYWIIFTPC